MSCAVQQPERLYIRDERTDTAIPADVAFLARFDDFKRLGSEAGARIRFTVMQILWRVGWPDSLPVLLLMTLRAVRRSVNVGVGSAFGASVRRGRSGKRRPILPTRY